MRLQRRGRLCQKAHSSVVHSAGSQSIRRGYYAGCSSTSCRVKDVGVVPDAAQLGHAISCLLRHGYEISAISTLWEVVSARKISMSSKQSLPHARFHGRRQQICSKVELRYFSFECSSY